MATLTNTVSSLITIIRGLIGDRIKTDGRDVEVFDTDNNFSLTKDFPDSSSIIVLQNNIQINSQDFTYNSDTNQVKIEFITSGKSLNEGDIIDIRYDYYEKYSDAEIKQYLESALAYFPLHQYKKTFEITDTDTIVAIDNLNPTTNELYFIAIITSILIDPQNVDIRIPDLTISAKRNQSDIEQIQEAFSKFQKFLGDITLESIDIDPIK